ncbi:MAG: protocatechuate 3,4-dioxygenase subunit alpha [Rhodospirillales bacterium]|nr:protocatechuate 3,4-dioxygenase subunit alpha [Rhodospirillales bacterium]MDE2197671.1 protocatechuate 3,4-dioxygenase subunit alpha [Rhodospirillales bacterium]MDE2576046.1 protocatechuate 3,4-dioxygenase subunit alpha [Rhodospirillales bacterium]
MSIATAAQTIGPYWHLLDDPALADLTRFGATGERIELVGTVRDGDGELVTDGCIELWQPSPAADDVFPGFGRCATDAHGRFRFITLKPGPVPGRGNTLQAPHLAINILARGILTRLYTRAYFEGEPLNAADPLLGLIEDPARRATLIARPVGLATWQMDIRLQGNDETVFIEV